MTRRVFGINQLSSKRSFCKWQDTHTRWGGSECSVASVNRTGHSCGQAGKPQEQLLSPVLPFNEKRGKRTMLETRKLVFYKRKPELTKGQTQNIALFGGGETLIISEESRQFIHWSAAARTEAGIQSAAARIQKSARNWKAVREMHPAKESCDLWMWKGPEDNPFPVFLFYFTHYLFIFAFFLHLLPLSTENDAFVSNGISGVWKKRGVVRYVNAWLREPVCIACWQCVPLWNAMSRLAWLCACHVWLLTSSWTVTVRARGNSEFP